MNKGFWRHERFMDVTIYVLKITYRGPTYLKAKIEWWSRGVFIGIRQNITIATQDLRRWHRA